MVLKINRWINKINCASNRIKQKHEKLIIEASSTIKFIIKANKIEFLLKQNVVFNQN